MARPGTYLKGHLDRQNLVAFARDGVARGDLLVRWDAGGDATPVWCEIHTADGGLIEPDRRAPGYRLLCDLVTHTLRLPNSAEGHYHAGWGKVLVDSYRDHHRLRLRVTSRDYVLNWMAYSWKEVEPYEPNLDRSKGRLEVWDEGRLWRRVEDGDGQHRIVVPIEGRHDAEAVLHRAEIALIGEIDRNESTRTEVRIDVVDGDAITLSAETMDYYRGRVFDALVEAADLLADDATIPGIYIEAPLRPGGTICFEVLTAGYTDLRLYDDEHVQLT